MRKETAEQGEKLDAEGEGQAINTPCSWVPGACSQAALLHLKEFRVVMKLPCEGCLGVVPAGRWT
jgi:hypothetical protein